MSLGYQALFWGLISAVSLPLGALAGIVLKPGRRVTSVLMAFGAGALLFALTIELFGLSIQESHEHGSMVVVATIIGAIIGGVIFDLLNQLLNNKGGFLRKFSLVKKHIEIEKRDWAEQAISQLSRVELLNSLPADDIVKLIPHMKREKFKAEQVIFRQQELGDTLYFIISGEVDIIRDKKIIARLGEGETFGEMAIVTDRPRSASAKTISATEVFKIYKSDFDALLAVSPVLRERTQNMVEERIDNLTNNIDLEETAKRWKETGLTRLKKLSMPVSEEEIHHAQMNVSGRKGASMAIWLGILIDGIPESLVIGMFTKSIGGVSLALIAGVFLANLPEAMSSSVGMKKGGMKTRSVILMWVSLCLITGIGAFLGTLLPERTGAMFYVFAGIEGIAAGAMLTAIAETMLPEAFEQGGAIVGMATLVGFLTALVIKII